MKKSADKAIIAWDYNGTLIDDASLWLVAAQAYFEVLNYNFSMWQLRSAFQMPVIEMFSNLGINAQRIALAKIEAADEAFLKVFKKSDGEIKLREGVLEVLSGLQKLGYRQVVVSNYDQLNLEVELKKAGIDGFFDHISGRESNQDVFTRTTKGARFRTLVKQMGFAFSKVVLIGDTAEEAYIGRQLGAKSIGILGGYGTTLDLTNASHSVVIHQPSAIPLALKRLGI